MYTQPINEHVTPEGGDIRTETTHKLIATAEIRKPIEFQTLFYAWQDGRELEMELGEELALLERRARLDQPATPLQLLLPIEVGGVLATPASARGWTVFELRYIPSPNSGALISLRSTYEDSLDETWSKACAARQRFEAVAETKWDTVRRIGGTPASTLGILLAKCLICRMERLPDHPDEFGPFALGLLEDIERLAHRLQEVSKP